MYHHGEIIFMKMITSSIVLYKENQKKTPFQGSFSLRRIKRYLGVRTTYMTHTSYAQQPE